MDLITRDKILRIQENNHTTEPCHVQMVQRSAEVLNEDHKQIRLIATTEEPDTTGFVVMRDGVNPSSYFFTNKAIFLDHNKNYDSHIGTLRRAFRRGPDIDKDTQTFPMKTWVCDVNLKPDNWHSESIFRLAQEGLIGASIGFRSMMERTPTQSEIEFYERNNSVYPPERVFDNWEWMELSVVAFPANPSCKAIPMTELHARQQELLDELVCRDACSRDTARLLGLEDSTANSFFLRTVPKKPTITLKLDGE